VGKSTAAVLGAQVRGLNPNVAVEALVERVGAGTLERLLAGMEIVLECFDDPETKFLVNDFCSVERVPLVIGGATGLLGQVVSVPPGGACYRCLFGAPPADGGRTCREMGVRRVRWWG
jgi:adenylyltransferase/sulfurtransferase